MDNLVTRLINSPVKNNILFDAFAILITNYGIFAIILFVIFQWPSRIDRSHVRHTCLVAGLSFFAGLGLNQIILLFLHRVRPYDAGISHLIVPRSADWSFPSDHATASIAVVAAFGLLGLRGRAWLLGCLAFLVCWSRVYVGTHYVTDILGGAVTGWIAAITVRWLYRKGSQIDRFATGIL